MSAITIRNRTNGDALATLDLTSVAAASRRFELTLGQKGVPQDGARLLGFDWVKSTAEVVTVTVSKIDTADSDREYIVEGPVSDLGELTGSWRPKNGEEILGHDPEKPSANSNWKWRLQFSQAGGACAASPTGTVKGV